MKHILGSVLLMLSFTAAAQQPAVSELEINARIKSITDQRNWMSDEAAYWKAKAVVFEADAAALKKSLAEVKEKTKECKIKPEGVK